MKQDFDELVRDSMTRFTDGVGVPPELAANARLRNTRHRQRARIGWLAGGAAVTGAAALAIGTIAAGTAAHPSSPRRGHHVTVQTTAMVINRVERALTNAAVRNPVAYTREIGAGYKVYVMPPHGKPALVGGRVISSWSRGGLRHTVFGPQHGKPSLSMQVDSRSGRTTETSISYPQRVWWRQTFPAAGGATPKPTCTLVQVQRTPAQWAAEVKKLLSCGVSVAGHQKISGAAAIKLKLNSHHVGCAAASDGRDCVPQDAGWHGSLWVNARTYLPIRLVSHGRRYAVRIDFGWLRPTPANLAKLHQPIPSGFRHV